MRLKLVLAALTVLAGLAPAAAQTYPNRRIVLVVPYTAGSGFDITARLVGQKIQERWGQAVVVDNKTGASSTIGAEIVANADPDGYTILVTGAPHTVSPSLIKNLRYDPVGFTSLGNIGLSGIALTVNPTALPVKTLKEFIEAVKAKPGKLNYSSPGPGTLQHLGMELLKQQLGLEVVHVPYRGAAPALTDLITGQIQFAYLPVHTALPHAREGKLRMIAVAGQKRSPYAPDVPSIGELGLANVDFELWYGLFGPPKLPAEIVAKWEKELAALANDPDMIAAFRKQGIVPGFRDAAATAALVKSEIARWGAVAQKAGIRPE